MASHVTFTKVGSVVVWGDDSGGQIRDAPKTKDIEEVVPGGNRQSLVIHKDRSLTLWGGQNIPTPVPFLSASVPAKTGQPVTRTRYLDAAIGLEHMVAIKEDDRSLVFSGQYFGSTPSESAANTPPGGGFIAVAAGGGQDIAIREDGSLHQWGTDAAAVLKIEPPKGSFIKVRARSGYLLALSANNVLFGWGGVFNDPLDPDLWGPPWQSDGLGHWFHPGPFIDMDAGPNQHDYKKNPNDPNDPTITMPHVLGLYDSGVVEGWGANNSGETETQHGDFQAVAAGKAYSLGLLKSGFLHQWGSELPAALRSGPDRPPRSLMPKGGGFISISAAVGHAVALRLSPQFVTGPDIRERTLRQPSLETQVHREVDHELSDAVRIRGAAVAD